MLKKENRLTKRKEIDEAFKKGKSSFDKVLGVKVSKTENKINRFAIIISAKVSKKAVIRNRKKRQLREIIRHHLPELKPGFDFFILGLPAIADAQYHEIEHALLQHFRKLKILK